MTSCVSRCVFDLVRNWAADAKHNLPSDHSRTLIYRTVFRNTVKVQGAAGPRTASRHTADVVGDARGARLHRSAPLSSVEETHPARGQTELRAVHTIYSAVRRRTAIRSNRRSHYARRRTASFWLYRRNRDVRDFSAWAPGSRIVLQFSHLTYNRLSELLIFPQKFNTNFPRPYAIRRCKDIAEKFNSLHKRHLTAPRCATRCCTTACFAPYGTVSSVNGPLVSEWVSTV